MKRAIEFIRNNRGSVRKAAKLFKIPRSSLQFRLNSVKTKFKPSVLTDVEEAELIDFMNDISRRGFPRKKEDIQSCVEDFLKIQPRRNQFTNNRPGLSWYFGFLKRVREHLNESVKISNCKTNEDTQLWFNAINKYITEESISDVIDEPGRVFMVDQTTFDICTDSGNVYIEETRHASIQKAAEKITVLFSFAANGTYCNPMIVYPFRKVPDEVADGVPVGWSFGRNETGTMTAQILYEYITNVFHTKLQEDDIQFPVILFVDGQKTHLTIDVLEMCKALQIHLIAVYSNAKDILSSGDLALTRPIKTAWRKALKNWLNEKKQEPIANKLTFAPLLQSILEEYVNVADLTKSFLVTGLQPFEYNHIREHKTVDSNEDNVEDIVMYLYY